MSQDFSKVKFSPFQGIIVDNIDPAKMGRLRIKIFGLHSEDKNEVHPWAQVLLPTTNSRTSSVPKVGEWVFGFFQDGEQRQHPVVMGVHPGIVPSTTYINETVTAGNNFKLSPVIYTQPPATAPKPPAGIAGDVPGEPTTPKPARGVMENTMVNKQNNDLSHVCDFISEAEKNIGLRPLMQQAGKAIRDAIRSLLRLLGFGDATGQATWAVTMLQKIQQGINWFQKNILKPIQDFQKYVLAYITKMRAIVQWIMSLPAKFMALLQDCLQRVLKLIGTIFTDTIGGFSEGMNLNEGGDFTKLIDEAKKVADSAGQVLSDMKDIIVNTAAIPVALTAGMFQPTTQSEVDAANAFIKEYESSDSNKVPKQNEGSTRP